MCSHKDWFRTYNPVNSASVHMGNNAQCNVTGIGTVKVKTHDGAIRTLSNVRYVPDLKVNLTSLGTLESKGCKYPAEGGVPKVSKGTQILLGCLRHGTLYVFRGSTVKGPAVAASSPNGVSAARWEKSLCKSPPSSKFKNPLNSTVVRFP